MKRHLEFKKVLVVLLLVAFCAMLYACSPYEGDASKDLYTIVDDDNNYGYKDHTTRDEAVDRVTDDLDNLLEYLDGESLSSQGYYLGADVAINTTDPEDGPSAFVLKIRANLYTLPYPEEPVADNYPKKTDDPKYIAALAQYKIDKALYNSTIKKSDIVIEWYDGMTNTMLIGFYFDGVNQNMADSGNDLYLNLQGTKRRFEDFGDTVLFQQLIRILTQFDLNVLLSSSTGDETGSDSTNTLNSVLKMAVTTNYKQVINGEETSVYFYNVNLGEITGTITEYIQNFFGPFEDKIDPLSNKYLGFKFSTLGNTTISTLNSNMQFLVTPLSYYGITSEGDKEILTGAVVDLSGNSSVLKPGNTNGTTVPFDARVAFDYSLQISDNIVLDKSGYKLYEYGQYEFIGELFIPNEDQQEYELHLDALIRTDVNEDDNTKNRVFAQFRDQANDDLIIGGYYLNELTYLDIEGLQHLYGGIKFEDLNLPQAYKAGFDLSSLLSWLSDTIDYYIVALVDELLSPSEDSAYDNLTETIMQNVFSTMKTPDDPTSRNTISIKIDMKLLRAILQETNPEGGDYSTDQMISLVNGMFGIDIKSLASILGYNVEELIDALWFYVTYDVDDYSISIKAYQILDDTQSSTNVQQSGSVLIMQLDLQPVKIGESVKIVFPDFSGFLPLKKVMTYSGYVEGQFLFSMDEEVDLSELMGAFIGDLSGANTHYILPEAADVHFEMYYDQYIREQILDNGRWTTTGRSAFNIYFYAMVNETRIDLFKLYANDVSFDTSSSIEELGYVWVDLLCVDDIPRMKIREDNFLEYFYQYMGYDLTDDDTITLGLTDILQAFMDDSYVVFEPDVIRVTTSNQTIKNFFGVDDLIATLAAEIGFTQRVLNIDELEVYFAMYTVGELDDISNTSPYTVELHDTVDVYFDYGTRVDTRAFIITYDPASIAVNNNQTYYYPTFDGLFMGVTRSYTVHITGVDDAQKSEIVDLVNDSETWEPLPIRELPDAVQAYYGTSEYMYLYDREVKYHFYGYYDDSIDMYVIPNDYGYYILYDADNDVYVIDLNTATKYDNIFKVLPSDAEIYTRKLVTEDGISMLYDIGCGYAGYYVVQNMSISILYYCPGGIELVKKRMNIVNTATETVTQFMRKEGFYLVETEDDIAIAEALLDLGDDAVVMAMRQTKIFNNYVSVAMYFDMSSGYFVVTSMKRGSTDYTTDYTLLYSPIGGSLLYTSETVSTETEVDPTLNTTKLVKQDFFLFNPFDNATIDETTTCARVNTTRRNQLVAILGSAVTIQSSVLPVTGARGTQYYFRYDMQTGYYVYSITGGHYTYEVVYDLANTRYYSNAKANYITSAANILGVTVISDNGVYVNWDTIGRKNGDWDDIDKAEADLTKVDWSSRKWDGIAWGEIDVQVNDDGYFEAPLSGGIYLIKVTIGEGMMATYTQYVPVQILNRTVDTDSYINVTVNVDDNTEVFPFVDASVTHTAKVIAPVVNADNAIAVDPYAYILMKAYYAKYMGDATEFVQWLFAKYDVTINFTSIFGDSRDTAAEIGKFVWYFDDPRGTNIYYKETDINNRVKQGSEDTTYLYTVFEGQVVALKLAVQSRTIDYLQFEDEAYGGTYTVDAIVEDTYVIPQTPVIYFKETDANGNPYTLDLANFNYISSSIFADMYRTVGVDLQAADLSDSSSLLTGYLNWNQPVANNVGLDNVLGTRDLGDLDGDGVVEYPYETRDYVKPFLGSTSDVDSSFFDIQNYVDADYSWFSDGWFKTDVVTVIVFMPNKEVDTRSYTTNGGTFDISDVGVQDGAENGVYMLDPYNTASWTLPQMIKVRFNNGDGNYYEMEYPVTWDTSNHVARDAGGRYIFKNVDIEEAYFIITTRIGNDSLGYIELRVLVCNLSGHVECTEYLDASGNVLIGSLDIAPTESTAYGDAYLYEVDTYARFEVPSYLRIRFADGTVRTYAANWEAHAPWVQNTDVIVNSVVGTTLTAKVPLIFSIAARTITDIAFENAVFGVENIAVDIAAKKITVSGVTITANTVNSLTPYDYLLRLLSNIELSFAEITDTINVLDAVASVEDVFYRTFDTQKIMSVDGQSFVIRLGQGAGADDYVVTFKAAGAKVITSYTIENDEGNGNYPIYNFRIYDDDNNFRYPEGFVLGDEIILTVHYSDGTSYTFSSSTIALEEWVVAMPNDIMVDGSPVTEAPVTMIGINEGDLLTEISDIVLDDGGVVWISTMLPDGSRVFVRLSAICPEITDNYSSDNYVGTFAISNGVITVSDYYALYPLADNVTVGMLPTTIKVTNAGESVALGVTVENVVWTLAKDIESTLNAINYTGAAQFLLATANIWGNNVSLYMQVLDCTAVGVTYDDAADNTKDFVSVNQAGAITVNFDAYENSGYNGVFTLPANLTILFAGGGRHTLTAASYMRDNVSSITNISYDFDGAIIGGAVTNDVNVVTRLEDNVQDVSINLHFYDKTVDSIVVDGYAVPDNYSIDPYGDDISIPRNIEIRFVEGNSKFITTNWTTPANYEVKYDTYQRVLSAIDGRCFTVNSSLASGGITAQNLAIYVTILDRVIDSWSIISGVTDNSEEYSAVAAEFDNPNSYYVYDDPFTGRAAELPQKLLAANGSFVYGLTDFDIVWEFSDANITADGTLVADAYGKYGIVYTGYLKNQSVGQPISIRIYVSKWEYQGIRKMQGGSYQLMNEEIRFFFSKLTNASTEEKYQIIIKKTVPSTTSLATASANVNIEFYAQDRIASDNNTDYVLAWDGAAKTQASIANTVQSQGYFYLANGNGEVKISPNKIAYYEFETLDITSLDLGYGYGDNNLAIYVVNPFAPDFGNEYPTNASYTYISALAKGTKTQVADTELGSVTVLFNKNDFMGTSALSNYVGGGIYAGYTVTVIYEETSNGRVYTYTQLFNIMLVFLDVSPTTQFVSTTAAIAEDNYNLPSEALESNIKHVYEASTYDGKYNPYRTSYATVMASLNLALYKFGFVDDTGLQIVDESTGKNKTVFQYKVQTWTYTLEELKNMTFTDDFTMYSVIVIVNSRVYNTNIVSIKFKHE